VSPDQIGDAREALLAVPASPLLLLLVFLFGASIGSFLNVCIARWPHDLSVVSPPSRCPRCERPIRWYENIPIASWLLLRARCRGCGLPISAVYPLVELLVGLLWVGAFAWLGASFGALRLAVFATVMLGIAVTDAKHYVIPDGFTVFGLVFVIVTSFVGAWMGDGRLFAGPYDALIGACAGAGAIAIAGWLGEVALKKEAMGFGDVTLMAVVGAAVGPGRALLTVFVGALLGAVVFLMIVLPVAWLRRGRAAGEQLALPIDEPAFELPLVPFGVFLAPAAVLTLLWGYPLVARYLEWLSTA
jgi:leader peptidase (prepilin peptidase)/N-methyltransferase